MAKKIKMTKEVKNLLLGLAPMMDGGTARVELDCYSELPEEFRPTFILKQLTKIETIKLQQDIIAAQKDKDTNVELLVSLYTKTVVNCTMGWENFIDYGTQELIDFDKKIIKDLPQNIITAIFGKIMDITGFVV